ncbi:hypothetical protein PIB30_094599 [Stylosanthes scabra]|uniref:Uncharacterized protein n=1 Tax=Stylosanthes scabra TaxID=79078 RepID=A0ABU6SW73_9FABA|nr:hypothetical protein [Stylosanthes scabra]
MCGWWVGLQRKVEKLRVANGLDGKKVKMATHMRRDWRICVVGRGNVMDMEFDRGCFRRVEERYAYAWECSLSVRVDGLGRMGGKGCWGYGWHAYAWGPRACLARFGFSYAVLPRLNLS